MLKVKNGDVIRGYDFKPMVGREDSFVEGVVLEVNCNEQGYQAYKIECTKDVFGGEVQPKGKHSRVGHTVYVPWRVSFMEFQGRVINLSA
jgi:hypothetical protein